MCLFKFHCYTENGMTLCFGNVFTKRYLEDPKEFINLTDFEKAPQDIAN